LEKVIGEKVLDVLREMIGYPSISPVDDFYLVGGHSLLIMRVIRRLRDEHGVDLDARSFGVNSQVAALMSAARPLPETVRDRASRG
jgi:hypothetical protein